MVHQRNFQRLSSGQPFNINTGFNNSRNNDSQQTDRPNRACFSNNLTSGVTSGCQGVTPGQKLGTPGLWFDPCAFVLQTPGTFGNLGRNTVIAPGYQNFDATLIKDTKIQERMTLQFRAEVFNLLNHANFQLPTRVVFNADGNVRSRQYFKHRRQQSPDTARLKLNF